MPSPIVIFGAGPGGPPVHPGRLIERPTSGSGGGVGGLVPHEIRGVSIAFGSPHNSEAPLWQNLQEIGEGA